MREIDGDQLTLGRGKVYFNRYQAGEPTGERFIGDCSELTLTLVDTERVKYSSAEPRPLPILKTVAHRLPQFTITLAEYSVENLALALMGEASEYSQGGTPITGESFGPIFKRRLFKLANREISLVTVKKGATPLVDGLDYSVDPSSGRIYIRSTLVNANEGDTLTADYTPAAIAGADQVTAATERFIEGSLRYLPENASGPEKELEIWKAAMNTASALTLTGSDFGSFKLRGSMLPDYENHPDSPYYQLRTQDLFPPAKVQLQVIGTSGGFGQIWVTFGWHAAGDNGFGGTASAVSFRHRIIDPIVTEADWLASTPLPGWDWKANTIPGGTWVETTEGPFGDFVANYFAIRYIDDGGNMGPISNSPGTTPE